MRFRFQAYLTAVRYRIIEAGGGTEEQAMQTTVARNFRPVKRGRSEMVAVDTLDWLDDYG